MDGPSESPADHDAPQPSVSPPRLPGATPGPPERAIPDGFWPLARALLHDRAIFESAIFHAVDLPALARRLFLLSFVMGAFYGAVMGSFGVFHALSPASQTALAADGALQALASAVKVPFVYLCTLAVCLPILYVSSTLFGSRLRFLQLLALCMLVTAITSLTLAALAPITLFFMISGSGYAFTKLLNVACFTASGLVGVAMLVRVFRTLEPPGGAGNGGLMRLWMVIYAFVGGQMGWVLRPFIGSPDDGFVLFRRIGGSLYTNLLTTVHNLIF